MSSSEKWQRDIISALIEHVENTEHNAANLKRALADLDLEQSSAKEKAPDLSKLTWQHARPGPKGDYDISVKTDSLVYAEAIDYLKRHDFVKIDN